MLIKNCLTTVLYECRERNSFRAIILASKIFRNQGVNMFGIHASHPLAFSIVAALASDVASGDDRAFPRLRAQQVNPSLKE